MSNDARVPGVHRDLTEPTAGTARVGDGMVGAVSVAPGEHPELAEAIRAAGATVSPLSADTRGLVWMSPAGDGRLERVIAEHPELAWVQLPMAGVDAHRELLAAEAELGRRVWTCAKGAYAEPVAEHALALTLAALRFIPEKSRAGSWERQRRGTSLYGRRILVIGAGGIALEYLRLVAPFQPEVTVIRRSPAPVPGAARTATLDDLHSQLPDADVVLLAAASVPETHRLIGARELGLMHSDAVIVNIARGALIDTDALVTALNDGVIAGAGIDVTDPEPLPDGHPLFNARNTVVTMHSADTPEMVGRLLQARVVRNVSSFLNGEDFVGVVDTALGY